MVAKNRVPEALHRVQSHRCRNSADCTSARRLTRENLPGPILLQTQTGFPSSLLLSTGLTGPWSASHPNQIYWNRRSPTSPGHL